MKNTVSQTVSYVQVQPPFSSHDDIIKWKHLPHYWPFVRGIHRSPVNSPHKGQWRRALMFSLILAWINGWVNNREAGDLRYHCAHYDVTVLSNIAFSATAGKAILLLKNDGCVPVFSFTWCTKPSISFWCNSRYLLTLYEAYILLSVKCKKALY